MGWRCGSPQGKATALITLSSPAVSLTPHPSLPLPFKSHQYLIWEGFGLQFQWFLFWFCCLLIIVLLFETRSCCVVLDSQNPLYIAQTGTELTILLPQPPECYSSNIFGLFFINCSESKCYKVCGTIKFVCFLVSFSCHFLSQIMEMNGSCCTKQFVSALRTLPDSSLSHQPIC
jgi:hypothetical protein